MRRRHFLQAAGFSLVLPALESLGAGADLEDTGRIKRFLLMTDGYGFHTPFFYPEKTGADYATNDVTAALEPLRDKVTLFGGMRHMNGHHSMKFVATGSPKSSGFGDSIDQLVSRHFSRSVPFDSLLLSTVTRAAGGSFRDGIPVAMMYDPEEVFDHLFTKGDVASRRRELGRQQSTLDLCLAEANALSKQVSVGDRQRLDEYLNSIRETEKLVRKNVAFVEAPAIDPGVAPEDFAPQPNGNRGDDAYFAYLQSQLRFVELAFKFDLTRVAYVWEHGQNHGATHHGNRPHMLAALRTYARRTVEAIAGTLTTLDATKTASGGSLLDETLFLWTAGLGSAAGHHGKNVPAILAGGGLKQHGRYTRFSSENEQPLVNLYASLLREMRLPVEGFNDSNRTLDL